MRTLCCRQPVRPSGPHGAAGGFTIIEVLLALTLVIALSSIVLPFAASRVREATRAELTDQIEAAIWSARAMAQREGVPVRVLVERESGETRIIAEAVRAKTHAPASVNETQPRPVPLPLANLGEARITLGGATPPTASGPREAPPDAPLLIALALPTEVCVTRNPLIVRIGDGPEGDLHIDPASFQATIVPRSSAEDAADHDGPPRTPAEPKATP